jgi:hypothetical protein
MKNTSFSRKECNWVEWMMHWRPLLKRTAGEHRKNRQKRMLAGRLADADPLQRTRERSRSNRGLSGVPGERREGDDRAAQRAYGCVKPEDTPLAGVCESRCCTVLVVVCIGQVTAMATTTTTTRHPRYLRTVHPACRCNVQQRNTLYL